MEDAARAHTALVQEVLDAADGADVSGGLASARRTDRLIDVGVVAEPTQLTATRAVRLGCECTRVAPAADRAFVPLSHGLPRLTTVRAHLRRDRAANDTKHLAFARAAARSYACTAFAFHDRTFPADPAEIRISISGQPYDCAHTATSTTDSSWPLVTIRAVRPTIAITADGEGAARPASGLLEPAAARTQRRPVLLERQGSVQAA